MPKPVCTRCASFMRPKKNGYAFIEMMPTSAYDARVDEHIVPRERTHWQPYKLWVGDLWACKHCDNAVVIGALECVAEHFHSNFDALCTKYKAELRINDC